MENKKAESISCFDYVEPTYTTLTPMKVPNELFTLSNNDPKIVTSSSNNTSKNYDDFDDDDMEFDNQEKSSEISGEPCLVCGGIAKGLHFQVRKHHRFNCNDHFVG